MATPAPGLPWVVSRTWVLSFPMVGTFYMAGGGGIMRKMIYPGYGRLYMMADIACIARIHVTTTLGPHEHLRQLPARPDWLRPRYSPRALARPGPHRAAVRPQL